MGEADANPAAIESMKQENEELKDVLSAVQVDLEEKTEVNYYRTGWSTVHLFVTGMQQK